MYQYNKMIQKIINFELLQKHKEHNRNWPQIPGHP